METKEKVAVGIRWMIRRDSEAVLAIENACFSCPWSGDDFLLTFRQRDCIGMVAERDGQVIGYMVYALAKERIHLLNFAVDSHFHGKGVGTQLAERLKHKLSQQRRREISLEVRETNLVAQQFWRAMGFRAVSVLRGRYETVTEDAYLMRYVLPGADEAKPVFVNRISKYLEEVE